MVHAHDIGYALLDPNQVQGKGFGGISLLDIGSNEWNRETRSRLEAQRRREVHGIECPQSGLLDQVLGLAQYNGSNLHEFPIISIFVQSGSDGKEIARCEFPSRTSPTQCR